MKHNSKILMIIICSFCAICFQAFSEEYYTVSKTGGKISTITKYGKKVTEKFYSYDVYKPKQYDESSLDVTRDGLIEFFTKAGNKANNKLAELLINETASNVSSKEESSFQNEYKQQIAVNTKKLTQHTLSHGHLGRYPISISGKDKGVKVDSFEPRGLFNIKQDLANTFYKKTKYRIPPFSFMQHKDFSLDSETPQTNLEQTTIDLIVLLLTTKNIKQTIVKKPIVKKPIVKKDGDDNRLLIEVSYDFEKFTEQEKSIFEGRFIGYDLDFKETNSVRIVVDLSAANIMTIVSIYPIKNFS